jgi:SAM-dependent methyltransferase
MAASGFARVDWLERPWRELGVAADLGPAARLWRPAPFSSACCRRFPKGRALDLACGSGRDAVFLAMHGFDVEAWDRDAAALETVERIRAPSRRAGVRTRRIDLEAPDVSLGEAAWDLIVCVRFLERPLFPAITRALAPGGHLVYDTYREGQEQFGKPRRARFLLRAGELRAAFAGLDVLAYEEPSPPGGPWTARLHARRAAA